MEIIEAIQLESGSQDKVLNYLYQECLPMIKKYILNNQGSLDEVNDIFQDAVIRFYELVKRDGFKGTCTIKTFLFGISKNLWINYQKKKSRHYSPELLVELDAEVDLEKQWITEERANAVNDMMGRIGDKCGQLLAYSVFENLSMKEIALKMGFASEDVAKTNNYRCKQKLIQLIEKDKNLQMLFAS